MKKYVFLLLVCLFGLVGCSSVTTQTYGNNDLLSLILQVKNNSRTVEPESESEDDNLLGLITEVRQNNKSESKENVQEDFNNTSEKSSTIKETQVNLENQINQMSRNIYYDYGQQVLTGARLKGLISQLSSYDCAVLVLTTDFLDSQYNDDNVKVSGVNGSVGDDLLNNVAPVVQIENMSRKTSSGISIENPLIVNFGSILKNSVIQAVSNDNRTVLTSALSSKEEPAGYNSEAEYNQVIRYEDGHFYTKLGFVRDSSSKILRYDNREDFYTQDVMFSIMDTSQFESYVLRDMSGNNIGFVFIQSK